MSENYRTRTEKRQAQQTKKNQTKNNNPQNKKGLLKKVLLSLLIVGLFMGIAGTIAVAKIIKDAPPITAEALSFAKTTKIYDDEGNLLTKVYAKRRMYVEFKEIPKIIRKTFVKVEDRRFWEHFGVDPIRIGGAIIANFKNGFGSEGASTITQQLVKRAFLTPEKTLTRKIQEAWMAIQLEQKYSKQQILEMYLNNIYLGQGAYGVGTAAYTYFGLKPDELKKIKPAQVAMLASLPKAPSGLNPIEHPKEAKQRRNLILGIMADTGVITKKQAKQAKNVPIKEMIDGRPKNQDSTEYDAVKNMVYNAMKEHNLVENRDQFKRGGFEIYTTIDADVQNNVKDIINNESFYDAGKANLQAGISVLDTKTGAVKGIGGAKNYVDQVINNFATDVDNNIGSTAKPVAAYGPAIEYLKWSTAHKLVDEPHEYSWGAPIGAWDGNHDGEMTLRNALVHSQNVPAVKTLQQTIDEVGKDTVTSYINQLGLDIKQVAETYALGGADFTATPMEMAAAYAAFGNGGVYNEPHVIKHVKYPGGRKVEFDPEKKSAMHSYTAYMITDVLKDVVGRGTYAGPSLDGIPVAGKSGSTNVTKAQMEQLGLTQSQYENGINDSWFVGYTPKYSVGVWAGYSSNPPKRITEKYSEEEIGKIMYKPEVTHLSHTLFGTVMQSIASPDTQDFKRPDSVVRVGLEEGTMLLPSENTPEDMINYELFVRGTAPQEVSKEYKQLAPVSNLKAKYDKKSNTVSLTWDYEPNIEGDIQYVISQEIDGQMQTLGETGEQQIVINNLLPGETYTFAVTAQLINSDDAAQNRTSEPATVSITIKGKKKDDPTFPPPEDDGEPGGPPDVPPGHEDDEGGENGEPGTGDDQQPDEENPTDDTTDDTTPSDDNSNQPPEGEDDTQQTEQLLQ